jgi:hypothetical protein
MERIEGAVELARGQSSAVVKRVLILGLAGGLLAGGIGGAGLILLTGNHVSSLPFWLLFGFAVGIFYGAVTGAIASGVFLLVWAFARKLPTLVGACILSSLADGAAITVLFALVWLGQDHAANITLGVVHFNWIVLGWCIAASGVYFWLSWTAARRFATRNT